MWNNEINPSNVQRLSGARLARLPWGGPPFELKVPVVLGAILSDFDHLHGVTVVVPGSILESSERKHVN